VPGGEEAVEAGKQELLAHVVGLSLQPHSTTANQRNA